MDPAYHHMCVFSPTCRQGDPEEITRKYQETKTRYLAIQKDVKNFKMFIQVERVELGLLVFCCKAELGEIV